MPQTPDDQYRTEQRRQQVVAMRRRGETFETIGAALDPPVTRQRAHEIWKAALADVAGPTVEEARAEMLDRSDLLIREAMGVLERNHVVVSNGRVVAHPDTGEPLLDDGPRLAAIETIRKLDERRSKLLGADAPVRADFGGGVVVRHEVVGLDPEALT
jgi:hypothetical protein